MGDTKRRLLDCQAGYGVASKMWELYIAITRYRLGEKKVCFGSQFKGVDPSQSQGHPEVHGDKGDAHNSVSGEQDWEQGYNWTVTTNGSPPSDLLQ